MVDAVRDMDGITFVDLYREYPDFKIDSDAEIKRIFDHDIIIFQFPMHWFSTPALLKEYQDKVILAEHAYAPEGKAFTGKYFFCALSTGAPKDKFGKDARNNYTVDEFLRPVEQTMRAAGMEILPHYVIYGARFAENEDRLDPHVKGWRKLLKQVRNNDFGF